MTISCCNIYLEKPLLEWFIIRLLYTLLHGLRNSMNERNTLLYKNISLILFLKGPHSLLLVWEIDGETYTQRGDFFLSHTFFQEPEGANACTHLQAVLSERSEAPLIGCVSLVQLPILCFVYNVVITWYPSSYTPVRPAHPDHCHRPVY